MIILHTGSREETGGESIEKDQQRVLLSLISPKLFALQHKMSAHLCFRHIIMLRDAETPLSNVTDKIAYHNCYHFHLQQSPASWLLLCIVTTEEN